MRNSVIMKSTFIIVIQVTIIYTISLTAEWKQTYKQSYEDYKICKMPSSNKWTGTNNISYNN